MKLIRELILVTQPGSEADFQKKLKGHIPEEFDFDYTSFSYKDLDECESADFVDLLAIMIDCQQLDREVLDKVKGVLGKFLGQECYLVFGAERPDEKTEADFRKMLQEVPFTGGILDLSRPAEYAIPFFRELTRKISHGELKSLNDSLESLTRRATLDLMKVRKIHTLLLPKRVEDFWNIRAFSKYAVGKSVGGEFFDGIKSGNCAYLVLSSTQTYVHNSLLISALIDFKLNEKVIPDSLELFCKSLFQSLEEEMDDGIESFGSLMVLRIPSSMESERSIEVVNWGDTRGVMSERRVVIDSNNDPVSLDTFKKNVSKIQVRPSERILIVSPGLQQNYTNAREDEDLVDNCEELFHRKSIDLQNELFLMLPGEGTEDFSEYDSSSILLEVMG